MKKSILTTLARITIATAMTTARPTMETMASFRRPKKPGPRSGLKLALKRAALSAQICEQKTLPEILTTHSLQMGLWQVEQRDVPERSGWLMQTLMNVVFSFNVAVCQE